MSSIVHATEIDDIRTQVAQCWNVPVKAKLVVINLKMNRDYTIQHMEAADKNRYTSDPNYKLSADAAMNALKQPFLPTV